MSFQYTMICALLAFVAIQQVTAFHLERNDERSIKDLITKAKEAIHKLRNLIRDIVDKALDKLTHIKQIITGTAKDVIEKTKESILEEIKHIKEQIEHIKEQAAVVNIDIKECVKENKQPLEEIKNHTISKLLKCATDEVDKVIHIVHDTIADVLHVKNLVETLSGNLKKCMVTVHPVKCLSNLIADVIDAISSFPALITRTVSSIIELVTNVEADLKKCAINKIFEVSREAALVAADVAKCVADKIRE